MLKKGGQKIKGQKTPFVYFMNHLCRGGKNVSAVRETS